MQMLLHALFVLLHLVAGAAWFGLALAVPALSRSAATGAEGAVTVGSRVVDSMTVFAAVLLVTALGAFFLGGGFEAYSPIYHASLGLGALLLGVQVALLAPAWRALASGRVDAQGRIAMAVGVGHLLWLVLLVLMLWPRFAVATA
ncbi:MAG TPA: hypothetical protein VD962_11960 [Rubricoccaceae bacterium]|nr:hypothetical protein [Rubricoccaceae bacterium]